MPLMRHASGFSSRPTWVLPARATPVCAAPAGCRLRILPRFRRPSVQGRFQADLAHFKADPDLQLTYSLMTLADRIDDEALEPRQTAGPSLSGNLVERRPFRSGTCRPRRISRRRVRAVGGHRLSAARFRDGSELQAARHGGDLLQGAMTATSQGTVVAAGCATTCVRSTSRCAGARPIRPCVRSRPCSSSRVPAIGRAA